VLSPAHLSQSLSIHYFNNISQLLQLGTGSQLAAKQPRGCEMQSYRRNRRRR